MSSNAETPVLGFLEGLDSKDWTAAVQELLPAIHEVEKNATQIWFSFFPLDLFLALEKSEDPVKLASELLMEGNYYLRYQIDSSHTFLYGHRYWPEVKTAIQEFASSGRVDTGLATAIRKVAADVAAKRKVGVDLTIGITAAGFMTLRHVGLDAFTAAPGKVQLEGRYLKRRPEDILNDRAKDDGQGLLGFLKTINKTWTVVFDEKDPKSRYKAFNLQEIASGAADEDAQKWRSRDPRCIDGPIPVQCRSAACGTCWVGVLGGSEKLSDVQERLEGNNIKRFGYIDTDEPRPLIRLACQARTTGAISVVIPPWNGVFGKYLKALKDKAEEVMV
jgi:ferredoxin